MDVQRIAAFITITSASLGLASQLHHHAAQAKSALDARRKKRAGFGFGMKR